MRSVAAVRYKRQPGVATTRARNFGSSSRIRILLLCHCIIENEFQCLHWVQAHGSPVFQYEYSHFSVFLHAFQYFSVFNSCSLGWSTNLRWLVVFWVMVIGLGTCCRGRTFPPPLHAAAAAAGDEYVNSLPSNYICCCCRGEVCVTSPLPIIAAAVAGYLHSGKPPMQGLSDCYSVNHCCCCCWYEPLLIYITWCWGSPLLNNDCAPLISWLAAIRVFPLKFVAIARNLAIISTPVMMGNAPQERMP